MAIKISGSTIIDDSRNIVAGAAATFTGAVSIGGTLTYEDVTNIDSVGVITAREGIFLPETYFYSFGDIRSNLLNRMHKKLKKTLFILWKKRGPNLSIETSQEALILASILEKETGQSTERYKISGVFHNRLRLGMRLQSDPTVAYALTMGKVKLERPINYSDLKFDSPYNTYLYKGLPPRPITNPGRAAIEAALHPEQTNFLCFVANGKGGHNFASTLFKHNQNVLKWRRIKKKFKARVRE